MADPARVERLLQAPNVEVVRKRKTQQIVEIHLFEAGDDSMLESISGSSLFLSHKHENETNPPNVWTLKHLRTCEAEV